MEIWKNWHNSQEKNWHNSQECEKERVRLERIIERLTRIIESLLVESAKSAKGENMPARIIVGGLGATFRFTEFAGLNGTGDVVKPSGPIAFSSDNPAVATVDNASQVVNPDGSVSVQVTALGANPDGSDATANISGIDSASANKVTASDVITVGLTVPPVVAQSATGVLTPNTAVPAAKTANVAPPVAHPGL